MACLIDNGRMVRQAPRFEGRLDVDRGEVEARVEPRWPTWWTVLEEISTRRARGAHHGPPIAHAPRPGAVQAR
jgi:hypothetical protein